MSGSLCGVMVAHWPRMAESRSRHSISHFHHTHDIYNIYVCVYTCVYTYYIYIIIMSIISKHIYIQQKDIYGYMHGQNTTYVALRYFESYAVQSIQTHRRMIGDLASVVSNCLDCLFISIPMTIHYCRWSHPLSGAYPPSLSPLLLVPPLPSLYPPLSDSLCLSLSLSLSI